MWRSCEHIWNAGLWSWPMLLKLENNWLLEFCLVNQIPYYIWGVHINNWKVDFKLKCWPLTFWAQKQGVPRFVTVNYFPRVTSLPLSVLEFCLPYNCDWLWPFELNTCTWKPVLSRNILRKPGKFPVIMFVSKTYHDFLDNFVIWPLTMWSVMLLLASKFSSDHK